MGERVRAVAGRKPLLPLFEVRTRRRIFSLEAEGMPPGEIALEETAIHQPGRPPARLRRVEIEVPEVALQRLEPFVRELREACALRPAGLSKFEAGILSSDLRPWPPERFGASAIARRWRAAPLPWQSCAGTSRPCSRRSQVPGSETTSRSCTTCASQPAGSGPRWPCSPRYCRRPR